MVEDGLWDAEREEMVETLRDHGIRDKKILSVMGRIPRHLFIPSDYRTHETAYADHPCPIGRNQTISQPYIVAYMTEKLGIKPGQKILEIGTGSGYQAAVLAGLGARVFTIEVVPALALHARAMLSSPDYAGLVQCRQGDGHEGWPTEAPFDAVIVTCGPESVPDSLANQLREGGVMIVPAGPASRQHLIMVRKKNGAIEQTRDLAVTFVPMVHQETQ